jgi:hypothetical protein
MLTYLKRLGSYLLVKEKALFKSATIYVGATITALPDIALWAQANYPEVGKYIPAAWQDRSMHLIGMIVIAARMRSLVKVPK